MNFNDTLRPFLLLCTFFIAIGQPVICKQSTSCAANYRLNKQRRIGLINNYITLLSASLEDEHSTDEIAQITKNYTKHDLKAIIKNAIIIAKSRDHYTDKVVVTMRDFAQAGEEFLKSCNQSKYKKIGSKIIEWAPTIIATISIGTMAYAAHFWQRMYLGLNAQLQKNARIKEENGRSEKDYGLVEHNYGLQVRYSAQSFTQSSQHIKTMKDGEIYIKKDSLQQNITVLQAMREGIRQFGIAETQFEEASYLKPGDNKNGKWLQEQDAVILNCVENLSRHLELLQDNNTLDPDAANRLADDSAHIGSILEECAVALINKSSLHQEHGDELIKNGEEYLQTEKGSNGYTAAMERMKNNLLLHGTGFCAQTIGLFAPVIGVSIQLAGLAVQLLSIKWQLGVNVKQPGQLMLTGV